MFDVIRFRGKTLDFDGTEFVRTGENTRSGKHGRCDLVPEVFAFPKLSRRNPWLFLALRDGKLYVTM